MKRLMNACGKICNCISKYVCGCVMNTEVISECFYENTIITCSGLHKYLWYSVFDSDEGFIVDISLRGL